MSPSERFKLIMKMKMDEARGKHSSDKANSRPMSEKAAKALRDMKKKKEIKRAKELRRMVIVEPARFHNGYLNKKGKVYDVAGNIVATVNSKNGRMATMLGSGLGQYKPKSRQVANILSSAINQYSPYYINLRKMQAMQAAGLDPVTGQPLNQNVINVHGNSSQAAMLGGNYMSLSQRQELAHPMDQGATFDNTYGEASGGPRQNVGATAWGAVSDNVWGTFTDNIWGTSSDTVWGTNMSDVWGGVGGNPYGHGISGKITAIWGHGGVSTSLLKISNKIANSMVNFVRKLMGRPSRQTVDTFRKARTAQKAASSKSVVSSAPVRTVAPPVGRR